MAGFRRAEIREAARARRRRFLPVARLIIFGSMRCLCLAYGNRRTMEALSRAEHEAIGCKYQPCMDVCPLWTPTS